MVIRAYSGFCGHKDTQLCNQNCKESVSQLTNEIWQGTHSQRLEEPLVLSARVTILEQLLHVLLGILPL